MYEKVKEMLNTKGLKRYTLAKRANITPSDLYSALKGERPMFPNWKKRIAEVLDVPEEVLFPESEVNNE